MFRRVSDIFVCGVAPGKCGVTGSTSRIDPTRYSAVSYVLLTPKRENFPTNEAAPVGIYIMSLVKLQKTKHSWDFRDQQNKVGEQKLNNLTWFSYTQCYLFAKTVYLSVV